MKNKLVAALMIPVFLSFSILPAYSYSLMTEFLGEIGLKFFQQGRYEDALHEFKKALLVQPNYTPAIEYIRIIEQIQHKVITTPPLLPPLVSEQVKKPVLPFVPPPIKEEVKPLVSPPPSPPRVPSAAKVPTVPPQVPPAPKVPLVSPPPPPAPAPQVILPKEPVAKVAVTQEQKPPAPVMPAKVAKAYPAAKEVILDESLKNIPQPINIEVDKKIRVMGRNVRRFLLTQPNVIAIEQKSPDELLVMGKDLGYTYLHIWDDNGRWTTEWLGVFPKIEGLTPEEAARRRQESARHFKLLYTLGWSLSESGKGVGALRRNGYSWLHGLTLTGPTPYGDLDSAVNIRRLKNSIDLTYLTMGLTNAGIGPFKKFSLRAFDFTPAISNLAFSGAALRGVTLKSPAFNNKLDYTAFWGREGGGRYGNLSPGLTKIKNSFLDGFQLNYSPAKKQNYKFTLVHGWGRDRQASLKNYAYDLSSGWNFDRWNLGYELAHDSDKFAHLLTTNYKRPKFNLVNELRSINRNFTSITGGGWRQGELGALTKITYNPTEKLNMNSSLDLYQSRLFPALDNDNRWNQDFSWNAAYKLDPKTSLSLSYYLRNDLGSVSQTRYQSPGIGISRSFRFIKDISAYANYQHQENKNFTSMASSYVNDRFYSGIRFSLIGQLYYYLNKEINWLEEKSSGFHSIPQALETGLDWSDQIGKTPFRGNFRFTYRNEEDTLSSLSFLSGEDHIEGYSELSYKHKDAEIYLSARLRNVWADNPLVNKRVDVSFNAGMRYLWDTGFSWDPVGNISGYVFRDINSDGLKQGNEPGVKDVRVWLNKVKPQLTDALGYYEFKKIKAHKAQVAIEAKSLPAGHVLTVPIAQEASLAQNAKIRLDFGIISRSEISGFIFEDKDGNGIYGQGDKGVRGVNVTLENGKQASTDASGRYVFTNVATGRHIINVDLNSIPVIYIPKVTIVQKIELSEGVTYNYNIPLRRIK